MDPQQNGIPTQVLLVTGKKANRALREAWWNPPKIPHNQTDLSQKGRNVQEEGSQPDQSKEAEHDAKLR